MPDAEHTRQVQARKEWAARSGHTPDTLAAAKRLKLAREEARAARPNQPRVTSDGVLRRRTSI
jgi:hypothetical protein